jgi:hypothetical protein
MIKMDRKLDNKNIMFGFCGKKVFGNENRIEGYN